MDPVDPIVTGDRRSWRSRAVSSSFSLRLNPRVSFANDPLYYAAWDAAADGTDRPRGPHYTRAVRFRLDGTLACQIFRPSFASESVFRIALGNRHLLRHEGDAIGQLSELVLVRTNNLQIPRLVEGLGDLLRTVEPQFRHAVVGSRNSQRS
jgi:hypothetical protein